MRQAITTPAVLITHQHVDHFLPSLIAGRIAT